MAIASVSPFVDYTGFHFSTYPEYLESLQQNYLGIYPDANLQPDSQDGQWTAIIALAQYDCALCLNAVFNAFSPATAQGQALTNAVKINGIAREASSYSSVDVVIEGEVGKPITDGQVQDILGQKWNLPPSFSIPLSGTITVTATADSPGAVEAAPNTINFILTPQDGWQSVNNLIAATPGQELESDALLRLRQQVSTMLPSQTILDGILGGIDKVTGVKRFQGYENNTALSTVSVSLLITGVPTTPINNGQVQDGLGQIWNLPTLVTIPGSGEITVTATPVLPNAIQPAPNTITIIVTPVAGWSSVTNPAQSIGYPPHSLTVVVEGGDNLDIANVIATKKSQGVETYGTTSVTTYDQYAIPNIINFFRPRLAAITVQVNLTARAGYLTTTGDLIKEAVANYISSLAIGENIYLTKVYVPANLNNTIAENTFDLTSILLSKNGSPLSASNIIIYFDELSTCLPSDVTVIAT